MSTLQNGRWWSYRREGSVGIWEIADWEHLFEHEIQEAEQHFQETASQPDITAVLVVFEEVDSLDSTTQDHITDAWSQLAQAVDIKRTAYVADGIAAMAVRANVEAPNQELDSFEDVDAALEWAQA
jgi:hypothetical protein